VADGTGRHFYRGRAFLRAEVAEGEELDG